MKAEILMLLSEIIDKMGIKEQLININKKTDEEVGKELFGIVISEIYKVKDDIYNFISIYKEISIDEAKKIDIILFIKEILNIDGMKSFLAL